MSKATNGNSIPGASRRAVLAGSAAAAAAAFSATADAQTLSPEIIECKALWDKWISENSAADKIAFAYGSEREAAFEISSATYAEYLASKKRFLARPVQSWNDVVEIAILMRWDMWDSLSDEPLPDQPAGEDAELQRALLTSIETMAKRQAGA